MPRRIREYEWWIVVVRDDAKRAVADGILRQTTRRLVDRATGETFTASADLPLKASRRTVVFRRQKPEPKR